MVMETGATVREMERELLGLPRQIQEAAAEGDREGWLALSMRRDALPRLLREARAEPVRRAVARLEAERMRLVEDEARAQDEPAPEVPGHLRGTQTPSGMKQSRIGGIARAGAEVGKELRAAKAELREILDGET